MADEQELERFERRLQKARARLLEDAPAHVRQLGKIIRRSVAKDTMVKFRRFLREHNVRIPRRDHETFRDYLIIHRIDLKDLEPAARERLAARTRAKEDPRMMTPDYRDATRHGTIPCCRDCRWFVHAPLDDEENGTLSCVEMGTKGVDTACFGFTVQPN